MNRSRVIARPDAWQRDSGRLSRITIAPWLLLLVGLTLGHVNVQAQPSLTVQAADLRADTWVATDALSRTLPGPVECGPPRAGKFVGIFYFIWLGQHGTGGPYDITKILAANPANPVWGPRWSFHHWGESEMGYYLSGDDWVIRRHAQMLVDAGVDTIILDTTNGFPYKENYLKISSIYLQMRLEGARTPQICFIANNGIVQQLYDDYYAVKDDDGNPRYGALWFRWQGKPLLLPVSDPSSLDPMLKNFFTIRQSWAWSNPQGWFQDGKDKWPWLDNYPQQAGWHTAGHPEEVAVCVAQHPTTNIGRSFHNGQEPPAANQQPAAGLCFAEQWSRALAVDPDFIFITGWNEWVAQRFVTPDDGRPGFLGHTTQDGESWFVDTYSQEYSRDIEPMKGGHTDNYYYQMVDNIRRFKGVRSPTRAHGLDPIQIDGVFNDWAGVEGVYADWINDAVQRNSPGWGSAGTYVNTTGRNDFVTLKVSHDRDKIYFYAQTKDPITPADGQNWMWLLIDADRSHATGWEGHDYFINSQVLSDTTTTLKRATGTDWNWALVRDVGMKVAGNELELAVPRAALGLTRPGDLTFDFHWADHAQKTDDVIEFGINGDSAPARRFNYHYVGADTNEVRGFNRYQ